MRLLWAVSTSLERKKINLQHPQYSEYVEILLQVIRRLYQGKFDDTVTSIRMLRLVR